MREKPAVAEYCVLIVQATTAWDKYGGKLCATLMHLPNYSVFWSSIAERWLN
jgi:hypothetical protein